MLKLAILVSSLTAFVTTQALAQAAPAVAAGSAVNGPIIASTGTAAAAKGPCHGGSMAMCVIAGLSLAQAAAGLLNKKNSNQSASDLSSTAAETGAGTGTSTGTTATGLGLDDAQSLTSPANTAKVAAALADAGLGSLAPNYKDAAAAVNAAGLNVATDGSKVTMPNGNTATGTSFATPQSMADAGFTPADAAAASDFLKSVGNADSSKKVASLTNADGSSGGGGASGGSGGSGGAGGYGGDSADALARLKAAQLANSKAVSGMSKKFGSDNIGVSGDNIFEMISRRYKARDQASSFIKN